MATDYFGVLGVARGASDNDIKRAYRRLARDLHPDVNPDPGAKERFQEVTRAYEALTDPEKRRALMTFVIIGGGPTGVELAQVFVRFGVPTSIVQSGPRLLPSDHPRNAEAVTEATRLVNAVLDSNDLLGAQQHRAFDHELPDRPATPGHPRPDRSSAAGRRLRRPRSG